jgi:lipoprotein-releasing system ATP-binding protein
MGATSAEGPARSLLQRPNLPPCRNPHATTFLSRPHPERASCGTAVPLVEIRKLQKTFRHMGKELTVLRGIDLDLEAGEVVAIVGQSGAGKSTLLHILGTLDLPTAGTVKIAGIDITKLGSGALADLRNKSVGFVFQFHHLLPEFDALENVMMPGLIAGRSRKELEPIATKLLDEVGLATRATHRPGELSGGEQQRVALARALLLNPKLLLADEPTGNLDSATSAAIHDLFFQINKNHGTTVVIVTHNLELARSMPRVVTLRDGHVDADERRARTAFRTNPDAPSAPAHAEPSPEPQPAAAEGVPPGTPT